MSRRAYGINKLWYMALLAIYFSHIPKAMANYIELDIYALAYHLEGDYSHAPRKLDSNGSLVFTPGAGITYNIKDNSSTTGISPIFIVGGFKDTSNRNRYISGVGGRHAYFLSQTLLLNINLLLVYSYSNRSVINDDYTGEIFLAANIGISKFINERAWSAYVAVVPSDKLGEEILFFTMSVEL